MLPKIVKKINLSEIKIWIKDCLALLFFPIIGLCHLIKECKNDDYDDFMREWFWYLVLLIIWCGVIAIISLSIWGLIYRFDTMIIPVSIIGGGVFVFFILPFIIHKLIHRK